MLQFSTLENNAGNYLVTVSLSTSELDINMLYWCFCYGYILVSTADGIVNIGGYIGSNC
jgi:hypothetical protein